MMWSRKRSSHAGKPLNTHLAMPANPHIRTYTHLDPVIQILLLMQRKWTPHISHTKENQRCGPFWMAPLMCTTRLSRTAGPGIY